MIVAPPCQNCPFWRRWSRGESAAVDSVVHVPVREDCAQESYLLAKSAVLPVMVPKPPGMTTVVPVFEEQFEEQRRFAAGLHLAQTTSHRVPPLLVPMTERDISHTPYLTPPLLAAQAHARGMRYETTSPAGTTRGREADRARFGGDPRQ